MEANELRIGNYIGLLDPGIYTECDLLQLEELMSGTTSYTPIPLNDEWVEKLGFKLGRLDLTPFMHLTFNGTVIFLTVESGYTVLENIKYVHQLQNLYYLLTSEELSVM